MGALVLRGCKSCGSSAEKKSRRGGRESDLGEHDGVSRLCCSSRRLGVCQESLDAFQQYECEVLNVEN